MVYARNTGGTTSDGILDALSDLVTEIAALKVSVDGLTAATTAQSTMMTSMADASTAQAADIAAIRTSVAAVKTQTDKLTFAVNTGKLQVSAL